MMGGQPKDMRIGIMRHKTKLRKGLAGAGLIVSLSVPACEPIFAPVRDLPAELAWVVREKEAFAQDADDPLADVAGGTVRDDLSTLSGCWGAFDVLNVEGEPPDMNDDRVSELIPEVFPFEDYEVYVFDDETGEMRWFLYIADAWGLTTIVQAYTGTFTIVGDNHIVFSTEEVAFNDPETGEMLPGESDEQFEWLVTLDGDRLKLQAVLESEDTGQLSRDHLVFRRFACPE